MNARAREKKAVYEPGSLARRRNEFVLFERKKIFARKNFSREVLQFYVHTITTRHETTLG